MIQKKVTRNRAGDEEKRMGSVTDGRKMLHPIIDIQVCHVSYHQLDPLHLDSPRRTRCEGRESARYVRRGWVRDHRRRYI